MFAHTVSHRTNSIRSRPWSWMTTIPEIYDEYPIASTSCASSTTSSPRSSIMHHDNDSDATIGNDILILQIAKESKLETENSSDSEPEPTPNATAVLQHPSLLPWPISPPPPSAYLDIAVQNPWAHETESIYDTSDSSSPSSPVSMAVPAIPRRNASRLLGSSAFSGRTRSTSADRGSMFDSEVATTVGGPRGKYSTKLLVQSRRSMIA